LLQGRGGEVTLWTKNGRSTVKLLNEGVEEREGGQMGALEPERGREEATITFWPPGEKKSLFTRWGGGAK